MAIVDRSERSARLEFAYGTASMEADRDGLYLRAEGSDATNLAYVKLSLAEHILAFAEGEAPRIAWSGDGAAGAPLPYFREMRVVGASSITPRMRRVRLKGADLARFAVGGMHVRLLFPPKPGHRSAMAGHGRRRPARLAEGRGSSGDARLHDPRDRCGARRDRYRFRHSRRRRHARIDMGAAGVAGRRGRRHGTRRRRTSGRGLVSLRRR